MASPTETKGTAAKRYEELAVLREPFLRRARDCAKYTIPALLPEDGHNASTDLPDLYQSLGSRGVNNLASKMQLALLPPSSTFFRLRPEQKAVTQAGEKLRSQIEEALSDVEQKILGEIETRATRVYSFELFKHLIVAGNGLLHLPEKGVRVFPMSQYVVKRDPEGTPLEMVVKEVVAPMTLPQSVQKSVQKELREYEKTVDLFTHIRRVGNKWIVNQEVRGRTIPESRGVYPEDKCPWLPLRWTRIDGEDWGRGYCEEYIGDLRTFEGLSKAIAEMAANAARLLGLVDPNGMTDIDDLEDAPNGAMRPGRKADVEFLQVDKMNDFTVVKSTADGLEQRLSYAFLLHSAIQRNAERVTAEEIRFMANELEDALGGVYSIMALEFQLPLVRLIMGQMERKGDLPPIPKGTVRPAIVTGMDALGRNQELNKLDDFLGGAVQLFGPTILTRVNQSEYLRRRATARGVDVKNLIYTEEEVAQQSQVQNTQALAEKAAPAVVKAISEQATQNQAPQPQ